MQFHRALFTLIAKPSYDPSVEEPGEEFRLNLQVFHQLFDRSPAQIAMLDFTGVILQTNLAWQNFGSQNGLLNSYDVGKNYLNMCEPAIASGDLDARRAYIGLLEVMHLKRAKFTAMYPCYGPRERWWYRMWVEPQLPEMPVIVVAHYLCKVEPILKGSEQSTSVFRSA